MQVRLVIDSNMLQSPVLREFLLYSSDHLAVLPEYVWFEIYKQRSLVGLAAGLSVIGDFPDQLIVLKPWDRIAAIQAECPRLVDQMMVEGVADGIRQMAAELARLGGDESRASDELRELWSSCRSYEGCSPGIGLREWVCEAPTSNRETPDERA